MIAIREMAVMDESQQPGALGPPFVFWVQSPPCELATFLHPWLPVRMCPRE